MGEYIQVLNSVEGERSFHEEEREGVCVLTIQVGTLFIVENVSWKIRKLVVNLTLCTCIGQITIRIICYTLPEI